MPLLPALLLAATLQADRSQTLGFSYAQILKMGPKRWEALVLKKQGDSTPATANGFSTYGDALSWRNDQLLKGRSLPLRKHLDAFSVDVQTAGYAHTDGGTMWNIAAGLFYRDKEETIYRVLTHTGKAPRRVVSDVGRALDALQKVVEGTTDPKHRAEARAAMTRARADLRLIAADLRNRSRQDSDAVLDFCVKAALGVEDQAKDI